MIFEVVFVLPKYNPGKILHNQLSRVKRLHEQFIMQPLMIEVEKMVTIFLRA